MLMLYKNHEVDTFKMMGKVFIKDEKLCVNKICIKWKLITRVSVPDLIKKKKKRPENRRPVSQHVWHNKDPSQLKCPEFENRLKFCCP
jgi:hypothetical protein